MRSDQGQGAATEAKLRGIQSALSISLRISMAGNGARWNYWHADMNAGSGHNEKANCIGSPIAFVNAASQVQRERYTAIFCDNNLDRITELQGRLGQNKRAECVNWDNRELLPVLAERIEQTERRPQFAWGSILVDPNGYFDERAVPHAQIIEFAAQFPRMDLVFNLNVRTYQLGRPHVANGTGKWATKFWPSPVDFPLLFNRRHWLVSNVRSFGGDRFCLFIGRSMRVDEHRALGIYHMDGVQGRRIVGEIEGATDAAKEADYVSPLQDVQRIPAASNVPRDSRSSDETGQMALQLVRPGRD